jgi:hypothetical protein
LAEIIRDSPVKNLILLLGPNTANKITDENRLEIVGICDGDGKEMKDDEMVMALALAIIRYHSPSAR